MSVPSVDIRPGYVTTAVGQVHVRQAGRGPGVLLIHDAPGSSRAWAPDLVSGLAAHCTVLLPDLIGFGASPMDSADAADLDLQADVLAYAILALGAGPVAVLGEGAGAVVAHRLRQRHPHLVSGLVCHLLPHGAQDERVVPAPDGRVPDQAGTHQVALFEELRDSFVFRPWWRRDAAHRTVRPLPDPLTLHGLFVDTVAHGDAHRRLTTVAAADDGASAETVETVLDVPTLVEQVLGLVAGPAEAGQAGQAEEAEDSEQPVMQTGTEAEAPAVGLVRRYVETSTGRVHVRLFHPATAEARARRPLLLLHANPGSGQPLEPLGRALGRGRTVIVWDTPGHGLSDAFSDDFAASAPLTFEGTYVRVVREVLDALGVPLVDVYGTHTGAGLAAELGITEPGRIGAVVLDGVPLFDDDPDLVEAVLESYFVDLRPDIHGSQLRRAWVSSSDMGLWWPWFNHGAGGARAAEPYSAEMLSGMVADMLRSAPHYDRSYRAAWGWQGSQRLPLLNRPVLIGTTLTDPLAAMTPTAVRLLPAGATEVVFHPLGGADSTAGNAQIIADFLDGQAG